MRFDTQIRSYLAVLLMVTSGLFLLTPSGAIESEITFSNPAKAPLVALNFNKDKGEKDIHKKALLEENEPINNHSLLKSKAYLNPAPSTYDTNLAVSTILSPSSQCQYRRDQKVIIEYRSTGQQTLTKFTSFSVSYTFGNKTVTEQHTLAQDVKKGETFSHRFSTVIKKNKISQDAKQYAITATVNWPADENPGDDKLKSNFTNQRTPKKPNKVIGDKVCNESKAKVSIRNPSQKGNVNYKWYTRPVRGFSFGRGPKAKTPKVFTDKPYDTFYVKKNDSISDAVKITEIDRAGDAVEITNLANKKRDLKGWTVAMWTESLSSPGRWGVMKWNLGSFKANEVKLGRSGQEFNSSIYINNSTLFGRKPDPVAVVIVKPFGAVVDFAVSSASQSAIKNLSVSVNNNQITYKDVKWKGKSIGGGPNSAKDDWQRVGAADNNDKSDWKDNTATLGSLNPNLTPSAFSYYYCFSKAKPVPVKVNANPIAGFEVPDVVCATDTIQFTDTTTIRDSSQLSYTWEIDGKTFNTANPKYVFSQSGGGYDVQMKVKTPNNCRDSTSKTLSIKVDPVAITDTLNQCANRPFKLSDQSTVPNFSTLQKKWTLAGKSFAGSSPRVKIDTPGNYQKTLKVTAPNGCTDSTVQPAHIFPTPVAKFTVSDTCEASKVPLKNNTKFSGSTGNLQYQWQFGNDSTSQLDTPSIRYQQKGAYQVALTATSDKGCQDTTSNKVEVFPKPFPAFTADNTCQKRKVAFKGTAKFDSVKQNLVYRWQLGDSTDVTAKSLKHTYDDTSTYKVQLRVADSTTSCQNTLSKSVKVKPQPVPEFSSNVVCQGTPTNFTYDGQVEAGSYQYDFGNGKQSSKPNPNYTYPKAGTHPVSFKVTYLDQKCSLQSQDTVTVYREPDAKFDFKNAAICAKENLDIDNKTAFTGDPDSLTYKWSFGKQGTSNAKVPTFAFSEGDKYPVQLTVSTPKGCKDQFSLEKLVNKLPNAGFRVKRVNTTTIEATAENLSYSNYKWAINDSSVFNPELRKPEVKLKIGTVKFKLSLEVKDRRGCRNTASKIFEPPIGINTNLKSYDNRLSVYPNPFGSSTTVKYVLEKRAGVQLGIYTANGKRVFSQTYENRPAGSYNLDLAANDELPEGQNFLLRLQIGDKTYTRKLVHIR